MLQKFDAILKDSLHQSESQRFLALIQNWEEVVGSTLKEVSSPLKIKDETLTILVEHSCYAMEMNFQASEIIKNLHAHFSNFQNIKKLRFKTHGSSQIFSPKQ